MRIIGIIASKHDGPGYHRVMLPLSLMDVDSHITNILTEEELEKGCDAVVVNRHFKYNEMSQVIAWREKYGFRLIVDIDDYWVLSPNHIARPGWDRYKVGMKICEALTMADAVTCTHERLEEKCKTYNSSVHILPNAIPDAGQFSITKTVHDKVRVFWQGSPTHIEDVRMIAPALRKIHHRPSTSGRAVNVMAGYISSVEWDKITNSYTDNGNAPHIVFPGTEVLEYYKSYAMADICVIPLIENEFNAHKSNLKVLEAAHAGCPVVVSNVSPYVGLEHVSYVNHPHDWYKHLKDLILDEDYRKETGAALKAYCQANFNFESINQQRKDIYEGKQHSVHGGQLASMAAV